MKNYEKYKDLVIESFNENSPCRLCNTAFRGKCIPTTCKEGRERIAQWLDEEYEPQIDWSKVPVDTPVICTDNLGVPNHRHFAGLQDGRPSTFRFGCTSWSTKVNNTSVWDVVKLAREEDIEKYRIQ